MKNKNLKKISYCLLLLVAVFGLVSPVFADDIKCSGLGNVTFDEKIVDAVHIIILVIQIAIPILLVIFGSIDFVKAITGQKDEEIKKGQQTFIKRLIAAALVFFIIAFVKLLVSFAAGSDSDNIMNCANCFINGRSSDKCKPLSGKTATDSDIKDDTKVKTSGTVGYY